MAIVPPLPPVTEHERTIHSWLRPRGMLRLDVASYTAVAPGYQALQIGPQFKFVQRAAWIPSNQGSFADEIGLVSSSLVHAIAHRAQRRNQPRGGRRSPRRRARAVNRHGLGGIFDSAANSQAVVQAQRLVGQPMGGAGSRYAGRHSMTVEQAHASVVGNILCDPGTVQGHGSIRTSSRDTSRYSRIVLPPRRSASRRSSGSARAAGHPQRSASRAASVSRS